MHNYIKIVVAGDVDSGKSTLIGRYLYESGSLNQGVIADISQVSKDLKRDFEFAYLLDSFEEERMDQLTIDTTQCFCKGTKDKSMVFIDVPGHQELLKNMLSGASCADIAILVIDVGKSVRDQTKRHAFILKFLGVSKIIAVVNKMDSVAFSQKVFLKTKKQIQVIFKNLNIKFSQCIPVSAKEGANLTHKSKDMLWYKDNPLGIVLNNIEVTESKGHFRFLIQDILSAAEEKVAAGIIISGKIKKRDKVCILPSKKKTYVKTIKYFDRNLASAKAPQSIGLVLGDMDSLKRGQVLSDNHVPVVTRTILSKIVCIRDIDLNEPLKFRCSVQQVEVRIKQIEHVWDTVNLFLKKSSPKENDLAQVVLNTDEKVVVEKYKGGNSLGRFVLLDDQEKIIAIGIIL
ncbi:MAG: GTP-binding protein [Candidatus Omnitrophota bacterium]